MPVPSDDLLKRREIPPEGVAAQAELFVGGDGGCTEWELSPPKIVAVPASPIEIPTELWLCFYGFDPSSPLTVTIRLPGGGTETHVLAPSLMPPEVPRPLAFSRLTGHPVGTYHATAQQGPRNASLDFDVIRAQQPQMLLLDPPEDELVVSMDIHLHLGGFTPNQPTTLHLYGLELPNGIPPQDKPFPYRTSFAVPIDANGEAHVTLDTKPDDPPGCYGFLSQLIVTDFPYPGICLGPPTT